VGPHISAVQYELDGIIHGLMANRDRQFVYGEVSFFKRWCVAHALSVQLFTPSHQMCGFPLLGAN